MFISKCLCLSLFEGHEKNYWVTSNWVSLIKSFLLWKLAVYFDRRVLGATKINRLGSENSKYSGNVAFQKICDEDDETKQRFAECSYQFFQYRCINRSFFIATG